MVLDLARASASACTFVDSRLVEPRGPQGLHPRSVVLRFARPARTSAPWCAFTPVSAKWQVGLSSEIVRQACPTTRAHRKRANQHRVGGSIVSYNSDRGFSYIILRSWKICFGASPKLGPTFRRSGAARPPRRISLRAAVTPPEPPISIMLRPAARAREASFGC